MIQTQVDKNLENNLHHIFDYNEVREKIIGIFGKPETDLEHQFIQHETMWAWKKLPCYKLPIKKHKLIHISNGETNKKSKIKKRSY